MLYTKISGLILSLSALTAALPQSQSGTGLQERGIVWTPRSLAARKNSNNNNDVTITDTTITQLTETEKNSEVQLTVLVEKKLVITDQKRKAKDNVRKNHYSSKNQNVDTIVTVVTQIIDIRDVSNKNTRYMTHQVQAKGKNNNNGAQVAVAVTEIEILTISASDSNSNSNKGGNVNGNAGSAAAATGTNNDAAASVSAAAAIQTVDANAPFAQANVTQMLPAGAAAPSFANLDADPARIIEDAQNAFVETGA